MLQQTQSLVHPAVARAFDAEWNPVARLPLRIAREYAREFCSRWPRAAEVSGNRIESAIRIMNTVAARKRGDNPGEFWVRSESNKLGWYVVDLLNQTCTCPDHTKISERGGFCKHRLSVGLQIFGPDWILEVKKQMIHDTATQRVSDDSVVGYIVSRLQAEAYYRAERAWDAQIELVDRLEYLREKLGDDDPQVVELKQSVKAASERAIALQHLSNSF
jgi:hypothetical protein